MALVTVSETLEKARPAMWLPISLANCVAAAHALPTPDGQVDVKRVHFDQPGDAPDTLGGHQRRSRTTKGIEDHVAADSDVEHRVGDHGHGFGRWML